MTSLETDYQHLTTRAGWRLVESRTELRISGTDAQKFLHNYCTADLRNCQPGDAREAFITSLQGKTLGHGFLFFAADELTWDADPGGGPDLLQHLDRYIIREDVTVTDVTVGRSPQLWIAGPQAAQRLEQLGLPAPQVAPSQVLVAELPLLDSAGPLLATATPADAAAAAEANAADPLAPTTASSLLAIRRVPVVGPACWALVAENPAVIAFCQQQLTALSVPQCSVESWEALRIEHGFPRFGVDLDAQNLPQELDRNQHAISFTKGCYLGQETVARIDALGHVNRYLRGLQWTGSVLPSTGLTVRVGDKTVGQVTSATYSPKLAAPLALGYIRREHAGVGTLLDSDRGQVRVVGLPLR